MKEALIVHKALKLIYNRNIDVVAQIYKGRVEDWQLEHLIDMVKQSKRTQRDNTRAWVDFILCLDASNLQIFTDYVKQTKI